jgi:hypothetical protein
MTIFDDMAEKRANAGKREFSPAFDTDNSPDYTEYFEACLSITPAQWRAMGHMQHILEAIAHIDNTHGGGPYEALHYVRLWTQEALARLKEGE